MVDIHCHIIPKIDDGPQNIEIALEMLKEAENDGIKDIIATPHFMRGYYETSYSNVKAMVSLLNHICENEKLNTKIHEGQEIYLHRNILDYYNEGIIGGLKDSKYYLFELNPIKFEKFTPEILYEFCLEGIRPIIAHPERYKYIVEELTNLNVLIRERCLFQLDIGSIQGVYGKKVKNCAEKLLNRGIYDFVGSDGHDTFRRKVALSKISVEQSKENMEKLLSLISNNRSLLEGDFKDENKKLISVKNKIIYFR